MFEKTRARNGVTIAEITVTLALVSIMITLITSFVITLTNQTKRNAANDAMRRDCTLIESVAERWMNEVAEKYLKDELLLEFYDVEEKTVKSIKRKSDDASYTLKFETNKFVGTYPDETGNKELKIYTETVDAVEIEILRNDTELLLILTVNCKNYEEKTVTFKICVNPHVGDSY